MEIFWRLVLAHLVADFTLQTNLIAQWKRRSVGGMLVHATLHPLVSIALTYPRLGEVWVKEPVPLTGWACVLLVYVLHFLEDEWRVYTIKRFRTPDNTLYFLWDQLIHYAVIFFVFPVAVMPYGSLFPEPLVILGCLAVGVTHFATVLIYFIEKDLWKAPFPGFDEKYIAMAERMVLAMIFLLPGPWTPAWAAAWVAVLWLMRKARLLDFSAFSLWAGVILSIAAGSVARCLYYC